MRREFSSKEQQDALDMLKLIADRPMEFRGKLLVLRSMIESLLIEVKIREDGNTESIQQDSGKSPEAKSI